MSGGLETLIGNLGVPVAVMVYLLYRDAKKEDARIVREGQYTEVITEIKVAVQNNTSALNETRNMVEKVCSKLSIS